MAETAQDKPAGRYSFEMPVHLGSELGAIWNRLRDELGTNPGGTVIVEDEKRFDGIEALCAVSQCNFQKIDGKLHVRLYK